ncbi:hypothetical protein EVAR_49218_1 [Eumeta japonica]|uniref:Uncharacterized protein n=1 Tax=Eumeta variegata TaxID=151549 RepID=A0A4C1XQS3_EUMVA|nr:hypothetical protein EVAR_49218_1 [Eumeta japonica]
MTNLIASACSAKHKGVLSPTLKCGSESWVRQKKNESGINAVEMRSLRSVCRVSSYVDRRGKSDVREQSGSKEDEKRLGCTILTSGYLEVTYEYNNKRTSGGKCAKTAARGRERGTRGTGSVDPPGLLFG